MRIERLAFKEHDTGWELAPTEFYPDVTLLVGASGVGKTRILRAIHMLRGIALMEGGGLQYCGIEWELTFSLDDQRRVRWQGRFFPAQLRMAMERLFVNDHPIFDRDADAVRVGDQSIPISYPGSCLVSLNRNDSVAPVYHAIAGILSPHDDPNENRFAGVPRLPEDPAKYSTLEAIRSSCLQTMVKFALAHRYVPDTFQRVVEQYKEIFPSVEDVKVQLTGFPSVGYSNNNSPMSYTKATEHPIVYMKEKGCDYWIPEGQFSSGMWRTLKHLARLALWPDGTVILIDEFETSLGINCLDSVTEFLNENSRRLQFIITSHHPYVINNIAWKRWKIVTRKGSVVTAKSAEEMGFDVGSRHQAFFKLINMDSYREGIAVP